MTTSKDSPRAYEWGVLWMILSATCLSISFLFLKINLSFIDYYFLIFLRFCVPLLFVIVLITLKRKWKELKTQAHIGLQFSRSLCVLVSQYAIAFFMLKSTLLNATVLLNAAPLFIPLIEWIFQGHRPGKSTSIGALIAFFGVILILQPDISLFSAMSGIGFLAALGQAGSQVLYGLRSKREEQLSSLFFLFFFMSIFSGVVLFFTWQTNEEIQKEVPSLLFISITLMGIATLLNQYFRGLAYRSFRPSTLATFLYFSVFVSALLDWLVFKNVPTVSTIIGSCLIILGGILKIFLRARNLKKSK